MEFLKIFHKAFDYVRSKSYLLLIFSTMFWGGNFVIGRNLVQTLPPFHLSTMRLVLGFLLFLPFAWAEWKQHKELMLKNWRIIVLFSITGIAGFNSLLYVALQWTTSINASLINSIAPLLIVILSVFFLHERLYKLQYIGIIISFLGVIWVVSQGSLNYIINLQLNKGDLLVILAVVCWSIYSMLMKKYGGQLPQQATFLSTLFLGVIILLPFFLWESIQRPFHYTQLTPGMWLSILYIGFFPSVLAFLCWNCGVISLGPSIAANFLHLVLVFSGVFALFIGESYTLVQFIGALFIVSGVLIVCNHRLLKGKK